MAAKRKPAPQITASVHGRKLPVTRVPVEASTYEGTPLIMCEQIGDASPPCGRKVDIRRTLNGAPIIQVQRPGAEPFVMALSWESLVRAALDAEEAHHAQQQGANAPADESTPGGRAGNDDARGST